MKRNGLWIGLALLIGLAAGVLLSASAATAQDFPELRVQGVDPAAVTRGRDLYQADCAGCHAQDQRGTRRGSDLSRSALLYNDTTGAALAAFLKAPHGQQVERVSFPRLEEAGARDTWAYLRAGIRVIAARTYAQPSILVGDPAAGAAYFNGAGRCAACHSPTGDFAGVGARYDMPTLQSYILMPPRTLAGAPPERLSPYQPRATVTAAGSAPVTGQLVRLTQFEVQVADLQSGERRTWEIRDGQPKVAIADPLQGHDTVRRAITDTDMHNLTAYLAGLK